MPTDTAFSSSFFPWAEEGMGWECVFESLGTETTIRLLFLNSEWFGKRSQWMRVYLDFDVVNRISFPTIWSPCLDTSAARRSPTCGRASLVEMPFCWNLVSDSILIYTEFPFGVFTTMFVSVVSVTVPRMWSLFPCAHSETEVSGNEQTIRITSQRVMGIPLLCKPKCIKLG